MKQRCQNARVHNGITLEDAERRVLMILKKLRKHVSMYVQRTHKRSDVLDSIAYCYARGLADIVHDLNAKGNSSCVLTRTIGDNGLQVVLWYYWTEHVTYSGNDSSAFTRVANINASPEALIAQMDNDDANTFRCRALYYLNQFVYKS